MEQMQTQELISALADGQLEGEAFARGVELAATDATGRQRWATYHLIGDVLRSGEHAVGSEPTAFLARLQRRLDREVPVPLAAPAQVVRELPQRQDAANESSFRWKLVAGFASVAAVSAIAWSVVGGVASRPDAGKLANADSAGTGVVLTSAGSRGVMIRDPQLDELLAAHRRLGASALQMSPAFVRNATFESNGR